MYFSKVTLDLQQLTAAMLSKWGKTNQLYTSHQWLWQLFSQHSTDAPRSFLFHRIEPSPVPQFYLLSTLAPQARDHCFRVETKPFAPKLVQGLTLKFNLRANPVVTRQHKHRFNVMMDAKYHAKRQDFSQQQTWQLMQHAAKQWLIQQGDKHGFHLSAQQIAIQHHQSQYILPAGRRKDGQQPIKFSYVDYHGYLQITDPQHFRQALYHGLGKAKAFGCGLLLIRRA